MPHRKNTAEFRYRQLPEGEEVLAMLGGGQIRSYGRMPDGGIPSTEHFHNLMEIGICRQGSGRIFSKGEEISYSPGTIVVFPKNHSHCIVSNQRQICFWEFIYVNPVEFFQNISFLKKQELSRCINQIESKAVIRQPKEFLLFERELDCLMDQIRTGEYGYRNCIRGLLFTLFMEIVKVHSERGMPKPSHLLKLRMEKEADAIGESSEKAGRIDLALDFVKENYMEDLKVSDIAGAAYMSESYLRRLFAENYNMSPLQYVNYIRIEEVCKILQKKERNINEAARKAGFENMSTFIKNFKRVKGVTPTEWIKNQRL